MGTSAPLRFCTQHGTVTPDGCPDCKQRYRRHQVGPTQYNRARWIRIRDKHRAQHPFCINAEAGVLTCTLLTDIVDHIIPHQGDERLMYDPANRQSMCWSCHSRKSAHERTGNVS